MLRLNLLYVESGPSFMARLSLVPMLPSTLVHLCNLSMGKSQWAIPRDRKRGHDLSLGAPMPGYHRGWPWVKTQCASPSCHRIANTHCFLPSMSHHAVQKHPALVLRAPVKQCLCLRAALSHRTVLRQRVVTMTCRADRSTLRSLDIDGLSAPRNSIAMWSLFCDDTC